MNKDKERKNVSVDKDTHELYRQLAHDRRVPIAELLREGILLLLKSTKKKA